MIHRYIIKFSILYATSYTVYITISITSVLLYLLLFPVIPVHFPHTSDVSLWMNVPVISRAGSCVWMLHVR